MTEREAQAIRVGTWSTHRRTWEVQKTPTEFYICLVDRCKNREAKHFGFSWPGTVPGARREKRELAELQKRIVRALRR